jgi:hypothetical protein
MSLHEKYYYNLPERLKFKRAKMFVKLVTILELVGFDNLDKVREYIDIHILEEDFEYMTIEDLLLLRGHGFLDNSKIYELFPEEFDYLDGVPVLMWDQL